MKLWVASERPFHEVHGMEIWFKRERHEVHLSLYYGNLALVWIMKWKL